MDYSKSEAEVLYAYAVLKRLSGGKVDTFIERLKSQKLQYLAQACKVAPNYTFNLYIRGPYSPKLASDLYELKGKKVEVSVEPFTPAELEGRFQKLKVLVSNKQVRELELLATFHWLRRVVSLSLKQAQDKLKELKEANDKELVSTITLFNEMESCIKN